jgi:hypothetical protein
LFAISVATFPISLTDPSLGAFLQKIDLYGYFIWVLIPIYLLRKEWKEPKILTKTTSPS